MSMINLCTCNGSIIGPCNWCKTKCPQFLPLPEPPKSLHEVAWLRKFREMEIQCEQYRKERDHAREFYAVRFERLRDFLKEHNLWEKASAILANGTETHAEPPTYAQQLEEWKQRAVYAEKKCMVFQEAYDLVRTMLADKGYPLNDQSNA